MKSKKTISFFILLLLLPSTLLFAQYSEDALRLSNFNPMIGARSSAMGNAFIGVADDYSAIYWNPAGLTQIRRPEFALGITHISTSNNATFLGAGLTVSNSITVLNNISFVLPFPVVRGSLAFALGFTRLNDFNGSLSFEGFNNRSSMIPTLFSSDDRYDFAWQLSLEDTSANSISFPISKDVNQRGRVTTSGGLNQWAFGGSIEIQRNLSAGLSLNLLSGSYRWERTYSETDTRNLHQGEIWGISGRRVDFQEFTLDDVIAQDISGWNVKLGMLYDLEDKARFGLTITTPTFYSIKEDFDQDGSSYFANGTESYQTPRSFNDYSVMTPWIFSLGASASPVDFFTVSGDVDLVDYSQSEFSDAATRDIDKHFRQQNQYMKDSLRTATNFRFGAEVTIPKTGLQIRGGFNYRFSPYLEDKGVSDFDTKTISFGIAYLFESTLLLNATYSNAVFNTYHQNYAPPNQALKASVRTDEKISTNIIMFSIAYRF